MRVVHALAPLAIAALAGSQPSAGAPDVGALVDRLRGCGLLSEGTLTASTLDGFYIPDGCYAGCLAEGRCEDLSATICRTSIDLRRGCDERCAHACADGELIANSRVCDGAMDCTDGSDESGCPHFTCGDGTEVSIIARCDGYPQCSDRSDELGCAGYCQSIYDYEVPVRFYRCDGYAYCRDGSDEAGCGTFHCESGYDLHFDTGRSVVCDGYSQCGDGSDERGCPAIARLAATCSP